MDQSDTRSSRIGKSSRPSDHGQKFDVFLSYSGEQKNFVRQLYRDLTNQGVSCFFDEDRESLPKQEKFPPRIFEAAKTCKVAVLLLSKDFLESKWPTLELSAFVKAMQANPNLKILPLYFLISPDALKNTKEINEKWKQLTISQEEVDEWHQALSAIRSVNGLKFREWDKEVESRDKIVREIWHILPAPSPRYNVRGMQGEARMCQKVEDFFKKVRRNRQEIRIAGLYGLAGQGKTTLGRAFCNFKLGEFEGKVCHLEFSRGDPIENIKFALKHLTHNKPESYLQTLTSHKQAQDEFSRKMRGRKVLLVLDNITEKSINEVEFYLSAGLGRDSCILLSSQNRYLLNEHLQIDQQSCMRVPSLEENEAIRILLERSSVEVSTLDAEDKALVLLCADRCSFQEIFEVGCDNSPRAPVFHPLALKAFGGYLFSKYGSNLSNWAPEIDRTFDGCDEVLALRGKAFDDMPPAYQTIFMLLTVYMLPNMSVDKVIEWMAINCNEDISFIEKAVEDLQREDFIEEIKPEIRIHDLYMEFAQRKAEKMRKWLWWNGNKHSTSGAIAQEKEEFELAKLEQCMYRRIKPKYLGKLRVLQLVHVSNMSKLDLGPMDSLRSITVRDCGGLEALNGMENLLDLMWIQIIRVNPMFKLPDLSSLEKLQYLEIDIASSQVPNQLGDLTRCSSLREIIVRCPSLFEIPRLNGLRDLEKVEFSLCSKVKGRLDCRDCVKLQTVVLNLCCQMAASPLLSGCEKLSKLVLSECDTRDPPDLTGCDRLEDIYFFKLRNLQRFPNFSSLRELKKLSLCDCTSVHDPPDIEGCHQLQVFHLLYNDNMKGLPKMDTCTKLDEIHVSWHSKNEVTYEGIDPDSWPVDEDLEFYLDFWKGETYNEMNDVRMPEELEQLQSLKDKRKLVKRYFRGVKLYYSLIAPYENAPRNFFGEILITLRMIDGKVRAFLTKGGSDDTFYFDRVEEYFAAMTDNARASTSSEISAKSFPMDQSDPTSSRIEQSYRPSDHGQKFDVFLSHSGKQKIFVRQIYRDLTNQGVSCFFDEDRERLPKQEKFPSRIFEAAKTCKVAVLLLSKDFLESKWPMLELSAFVKAMQANPNLKILPLYFLISPDALKKTKEINEKWKQLTISQEEVDEWHQALKAIRSITGLRFGEGDDEDEFRDKIVKEIGHMLLTLSPRYHVRGMQGEPLGVLGKGRWE